MARPKGSASALGDLPVDPLVDILSRVPAKSVCQFKCVSKAWRDLIADPDHRKKLPQTMEGLFYRTCDESSSRFSFIDVTARSVPLDIDPIFFLPTELRGTQTLYLMDSCNGLILIAYSQGSSPAGYVVCNPTTKEWEVVPPLGCLLETHTYLAFDPVVSSHFNLVQFEMVIGQAPISVHAYSSETGTWSLNQADEQGEEMQLEGWRHRVALTFMTQKLSRVAFVNGFLHLLVWDVDGLKIVAVDVQGKARRMIPVPHEPDRRRWMCCFGKSQGKLHYMIQEKVDAHEGKFKLAIWVLQGYDTKEWVLKHTVDTHDHEVFGEKFDVLDIHQDFNVVFLTLPLTRKLVAYGMSNKKVTVIATFDDQRELERLETDRYVPCFQELSVLTNKH